MAKDKPIFNEMRAWLRTLSASEDLEKEITRLPKDTHSRWNSAFESPSDLLTWLQTEANSPDNATPTDVAGAASDRLRDLCAAALLSPKRTAAALDAMRQAAAIAKEGHAEAVRSAEARAKAETEAARAAEARAKAETEAARAAEARTKAEEASIVTEQRRADTEQRRAETEQRRAETERRRAERVREERLLVEQQRALAADRVENQRKSYELEREKRCCAAAADGNKRRRDGGSDGAGADKHKKRPRAPSPPTTDAAWLHAAERTGYACLSREVLARAGVAPASAADVVAALNAVAQRFFDAKKREPRGTTVGVSHTRHGATVLLWRAHPGCAPDDALVADLIASVRPPADADADAAAAPPPPSAMMPATPAVVTFPYTADDVLADLRRARAALPSKARHLVPDPADAAVAALVAALPRFAGTVDADRWRRRATEDPAALRWLTMQQIRNLLPWPAESVPPRDHSTIAHLVQQLAGWNAGWKRLAEPPPPPTAAAAGRNKSAGKTGNEYHADACAWFARAAEIVAFVRAAHGADAAADRLSALNTVLRTGAYP